MATVTGFTAARMLEIENTTVVDGHLDGDDLILVQRDGTEINAGDVRGPVGPQGPNADVGDIKASIRAAIPGWLLMGQSIAGANVTYADLWAVVPASWKVGTTLNLPSMTDRVLQGGGTLGESTGGNTKSLIAANLPPHVHSGPTHIHGMTHSHPTTGTSSENVDHNHSMYHVHGNAVTDLQGHHEHQGAFRADSYSGVDAGATFIGVAGSTQAQITLGAGTHQHNVQVPAFNGSTGTQSTGHFHTVTVNAFNGNTGNNTAADTGPGPGASTAFNVEQAALRVNYFIRH